MIKKIEIILELKELYEDAEDLNLKMPYEVRRVETTESIIWYGIKTSWKKIDSKWFILKSGEWKISKLPKYEKLYNQLKNKK